MKSEVDGLYTIDRSAYEPAYVQLANILRRQIADGAYRPGDRLPSEAQLCERYDVSPMTVRRSINLLADQEVVTTAQGRGTFVKAVEISTATFQLPPLADLLGNDEDRDIRVLEAHIVPAGARVARKLGLQEGDKVIYIRRLLTQEGDPIFYHRAYLRYDPRQPIVEAEMDATSLQGLFTNGDNSLLKFGELTVEVTAVNEEEAELLAVAVQSPAFYLEHVFYDFDDNPMSWGWFIWRGDRLRFRTTVGIEEPAPS
ncbi:MAG: GntR family transcriptional regulator [Chloroflexota bacterium]